MLQAHVSEGAGVYDIHVVITTVIVSGGNTLSQVPLSYVRTSSSAQYIVINIPMLLPWAKHCR